MKIQITAAMTNSDIRSLRDLTPTSLWVVYTLLVDLSAATEAEENPDIRTLIANVKLVTVVSWCTYPIVYTFPMLGIGGSNAVVYIQIGYCVSDVISKCGVGLMIYQITNAKSQIAKEAELRGVFDQQTAKLQQEYDARAITTGIPTSDLTV